MSNFIPDNLIEEIRDDSDIVDIISEAVILKKKGKNYVGLCPFHSEKTPSFTVNQENQMFYCFGCGTGGNVYTFLMQYHGLNFVDAVKSLADRAGIQLPTEKGNTPADRKRSERRKRLYAVNELTCTYYHYLLDRPEGSQAFKYLEQRDISQEMWEKFQLGWAPEGWDNLCRLLITRGYSNREIIDAGVGQQGKGSAMLDSFRSRVMFPIADYKGRTIGFGGRVLGTGEPKYLNTGETELFQKGHLLYGLHLAIPEIRKMGFAVIVEGYTDVIAAHQVGICNVVASLGTALTSDQAKLLRRYTENVVMAYDADTAGSLATVKGMELLVKNKCNVRVAPIPEGKDPDSLIKTIGADAFLELVKGKSQSLVEYRLGQACRKFDISSVSGRLAAVNEVIPTLVLVENAVERAEYIKLVSRRLSLSVEAISEEVAKYAGKLHKNGSRRDKIENVRYTRGRVFTPEIHEFRGPEQAVVWTVVENPDLLGRIERSIGIDNFSEAYLREILSLIKHSLEVGEPIEPLSLIDGVEHEVAKQFVSHMALRENRPPTDSPELLESCITRAKSHILDQKIIAKQEQLTVASQQKNLELQRQYMDEINELFKLKGKMLDTRNNLSERGE